MDIEENPLDSIVALHKAGFRANARHIVIVVTDAPSHEENGITPYRVSEMTTRYPNTVFHTICPRCNVRQLSERSGGLSMDLPMGGSINLSDLPLAESILTSYVVGVRTLAGPGRHKITLRPKGGARFSPHTELQSW